LGEGVAIRPHVTVGEGVSIGRGAVIESGAHLGDGVSIGEQSLIGPNVVIYRGTRIGHRVRIHGGSVIGGDGFGYVFQQGRHLKVPQVGNVIIEDDVEIGCNVCVDRATVGSTIIRRGTKIDNLVQIAHNDVIGQDVIITGQVGLAGSVTVGDRVAFGGQAGVVDHVTIGHDARVGAATPVTKDVKPGETVWGFPARPGARVKRELGALAQLPRLLKRFRELLMRLGRVESRLDALEQARVSDVD
jgi:UDP-3-O-[3-hydroxymyristoyl] glucosamine N-acyltransferase